MVAFGTLNFFLLAGVLALPAIVLGLSGQRIARYGLVASLVVLARLLWDTPQQAAAMAGFVCFQMVLAHVHLWFVRTHGRKKTWEKRLVVLLSLLPLILVKLPWLEMSALGFLGISYVTFRATQVVVEISDGLITRLPLLDQLYFLTFFPVASSGPIDRSRRFQQDIDHPLDGASYARLLGRGLRLLLLGAVYKFVGALYLAHLIHDLPPQGAYLRYMYLYSLQLFFDFGGYSHMAVGLSLVFGVRTPVNFRMPFIAENIKDFWTRWHISLSFWLRDFVFTRVLMAIRRRSKKTSRTTAASVAYLVNMLAMGLWHGPTVHYLLYGLYHGLLMVGNEFYERHCPLHRHHAALWYRVLAILVTIHLVMFGFLIFSGRLVTN